MKMFNTKWERIEEVDVERVSESSVWINGQRRAIRSSWEAYHETWEAAHKHVLGIAEYKLEKAHRDLTRAQSKLATVKAMKPNARLDRTEGADKE